ncbi:S-DNA-T family DNA segregation ATPase FtsK/SpoIIIE [Aneurinibacillus soli]|uniref:DNA translocase FtsK n=1 Tax=Aneurinibacillus soli TaxID=1500254 RepID=A0A0U5BB64_9BACL|nr:FtsK/SpoIIIE domain-containing protein [Aneurinibacillus soli]PYE64191.1 S-DNA-T family DNA segregation ATPase FtsK/SpoIIIE [Aneurinibacillus soli]BAU28140.1 DNA translocase FtsK [Aneurinibacillus soli]
MQKMTPLQGTLAIGFGAFMTAKTMALFGIPLPIHSLSPYEITALKTQALKLAGICTSLGVANYTYQSMPNTKARRSLKRIFDEGEIYRERENGRKIYPQIRAIQYDNKGITIVFNIVFGINPDDVYKAEWLFKQEFGQHVFIEHTGKHFTVKAYYKGIQTFAYDFDEILPHLSDMKLPIVIGKDQEGYWLIVDMIDNPHLLICGETGSGKSTEIRQIITTWIKHLSPEKLHLYLCDLKGSEFHLFENIEHVQASLYENDEGKLLKLLIKIEKEIKRRGQLLRQHGKVHIDDLPEQVPYIVVCVDEVALLRDNKAIMEKIENIAIVGRSNGVFLLLSMQRPDSTVLDGKLKQCLTVRICFRQPDDINYGIALNMRMKPDREIEDGYAFVKYKRGLQEIQAPFLADKMAKVMLRPYQQKKPRPEPEQIEENKIFDLE